MNNSNTFLEKVLNYRIKKVIFSDLNSISFVLWFQIDIFEAIKLPEKNTFY